MTRRADLAASVAPIFVSADEGARRCMVGAETWRSWAPGAFCRAMAARAEE